MQNSEPIILKREVEASVVPVGTKVTLHAGEEAYITQSLGGTYTVVVNGNMFRIEGKDADALGIEIEKNEGLKAASLPSGPISKEQLEKEIWDTMRTCYDPEIPVNVVDLGLIYDCNIEPMADKKDSYRVNVKMTLTAPGCGMGPTLTADVQSKLLSLEGVDEANVELVWEPQWNQGMLTEAAKLQLGLM
jgi:probable FeS assembly SUF system protein SufT